VSFSVVPYLERRGIDRLDAVLVSHPDEDHLGGLPALVREVSVGTVLHGGQTAETDLYRKTRRLLRRRGISSRSVDRGDPVLNESVVRGRVLGPPARPGRHGLEGENDRSVVVRLAYGEVEILLPGDVEEDGERCLVRAYGRRLGSRVVKVPHHGSESSSTMPFVRRVAGSNTRAVVSVGRSNSFGMPSEEVLDRWKSEEARVRSTAQGGAVWLRSNGSEVWSVGWRE
jgi:competence protein ComEC